MATSLVYSVLSLPVSEPGSGSKLCSLVRRLEADNPAMCFSEPECEQRCGLVDNIQCQTRIDRSGG